LNLKVLPRANNLCNAKTRSGTPCKNHRMLNGRCRMHGGKSTGAKTPEGLERIRQANYKNGKYTKEAIMERKEFKSFMNEINNSLELMKKQLMINRNQS